MDFAAVIRKSEEKPIPNTTSTIATGSSQTSASTKDNQTEQQQQKPKNTEQTGIQTSAVQESSSIETKNTETPASTENKMPEQKETRKFVEPVVNVWELRREQMKKKLESESIRAEKDVKKTGTVVKSTSGTGKIQSSKPEMSRKSNIDAAPEVALKQIRKGTTYNIHNDTSASAMSTAEKPQIEANKSDIDSSKRNHNSHSDDKNISHAAPKFTTIDTATGKASASTANTANSKTPSDSGVNAQSHTNDTSTLHTRDSAQHSVSRPHQPLTPSEVNVKSSEDKSTATSPVPVSDPQLKTVPVWSRKEVTMSKITQSDPFAWPTLEDTTRPSPTSTTAPSVASEENSSEEPKKYKGKSKWIPLPVDIHVGPSPAKRLPPVQRDKSARVVRTDKRAPPITQTKTRRDEDAAIERITLPTEFIPRSEWQGIPRATGMRRKSTASSKSEQKESVPNARDLKSRGIHVNAPAYHPRMQIQTSFDNPSMQAILLSQIEYYFSVDNLCRDIYFRMQWDNEGYVPISFIAEFNRVKSIGANIYQIREVLKRSQVVTMDHNSRIRKAEGWEAFQYTAEQKRKYNENRQRPHSSASKSTATSRSSSDASVLDGETVEVVESGNVQHMINS